MCGEVMVVGGSWRSSVLRLKRSILHEAKPVTRETRGMARAPHIVRFRLAESRSLCKQGTSLLSHAADNTFSAPALGEIHHVFGRSSANGTGARALWSPWAEGAGDRVGEMVGWGAR